MQLTALLGPEALSTGRVRIGSVVPQLITPAEPHHCDRIGAPLGTPVPGLLPAPAPAQVLPDNHPNVGLGIQTVRAWPDASDRWYSFAGHIIGTRTGWVATYAAKPEIGGERLIAWGSTTEAWLADPVFDWGQRSPTALPAGAPQAGTYDGYRHRHYPATGVYVGVKDGRLYLYQPAVDPAVQPLGALADVLPTAMRELPLC